MYTHVPPLPSQTKKAKKKRKGDENKKAMQALDLSTNLGFQARQKRRVHVFPVPGVEPGSRRALSLEMKATDASRSDWSVRNCRRDGGLLRCYLHTIPDDLMR